MMNECNLCPRACKVNRIEGQKGVCGQTAVVKAARAGLHMWEEPCISGTNGSGTVFFTGCNLHCVFCQNHTIANGDTGKDISTERLAEIFLELQGQGANNINLVTGTHFVPQIIEALQRAKRQGLALPVVYNTSSYERVDTIKMLEGYVDIYLPDLKYVDSRISHTYSHAADYFQVASEAIAEMVRQIGKMEFYPQGRPQESLDVAEFQRRSELGEMILMKRGVVVRHLLLPGCTEDSKKVIEYLLKTYGEDIFISIMNQYTPLKHVSSYEGLNRKVTKKEYEQIIDYAIALGIENGFIQEGEAAEESFIPKFDTYGI